MHVGDAQPIRMVGPYSSSYLGAPHNLEIFSSSTSTIEVGWAGEGLRKPRGSSGSQYQSLEAVSIADKCLQVQDCYKIWTQN